MNLKQFLGKTMSEIYRITCGLPCISTQGKQTNFSIGLRVASVFFGIIGTVGGILIVLNLPGISQFGTTVGWTSLSIGFCLTLAGIAFKCVKKQSNSAQKETNPLNSEQPTITSAIIHTPNSIPQKNKQENPDSGHDEQSKDRKNLNFVTSHQSQIANIKKNHDSESPLVKLNENELFSPTWYQRQKLNGYERCNVLDLESNTKMLETLIICGGGHRSEIKQINIFPLCYKLQEEDKKIQIDLSSHIEVINSNISSFEVNGNQFYSKSKFSVSLITGLINKKEPFKYTFQTCWAHFITHEMPEVVFFTAHNGLQLEIGYINVREILGRKVKFEINKDNTIFYSEELS